MSLTPITKASFLYTESGLLMTENNNMLATEDSNALQIIAIDNSILTTINK